MITINIVTFFDEGLMIQGAILAASLARTATPDRPIKFHVFCAGGFQDRFAKLIAYLDSEAFSVVARGFSNPFDRSVPAAYFNPMYCARLCVGELLDCDRALYLDTDILVRSSLAPLYDTDLCGNILAAIADRHFEISENTDAVVVSGMTRVNIRHLYRDALGLERDYFNSGVLLIDLAKWRSAGVKTLCLDYLRHHPLALFCDQDALNFAVGSQTLIVGAEWNFMAEVASAYPDIEPRIIHFSGCVKPWKPGDSITMFHQEYWDFAFSTPLGHDLVEQFLERADNEKNALYARIAASTALIPASARPYRIDWATALPSSVLRPIAEFLCTFGKGKLRRAGVQLWNIFAARQPTGG